MAHAANRLAHEPSLYLRQHGHNPVDWYPWGPEALERARREQRPILLSIGYSACHWCHVMERESFEDEEIARLMNEFFVCIKVDREERPDLDNVYMKTVQMMTGRGGWPMTVFLTPDLRPFYAGTYFPPSDRGGMPGFPRVLAALARVFREEPQKVADSSTRVLEALEREAAADEPETPAAPTIVESAAALTRAIDREYGGFGGAPKFPGSLGLAFLMGVQRHSPDSDRAALLRTTLDKMADGGIYDHVGGGFHRYSVDRFWLVPHFEKMLYDQALLAETYGEAWQLFGEPRYAETAGEVLDYVAREMTSAQGAFFATQDADSEGEEGKFYLWTPAEVRDVVGAEAAEIVCRFYDVSDAGNFEGRNILHRTISIADAARMFDTTPDRVHTIVANARRALYERRKTRVAPATDTKILTDWNGLMIASMASVAARLQRAELVDRAARAADFVRSHMMPQGRLNHFFAEGEARVDAFLDDFAFFGRACLELFAALGRREDFECASTCADALIARFEDPRGGFFFTAADSEQVLVRSRDIFDGAVPSGNAVATELLLRLYELTGRDEYRRAGEASLDSLLARAALNPYGSASLLTVADRHARGYADVVVAVDPADGDRARRLRDSALRTHAPEVSVFFVENPREPWLPAALRGKSPIRGRSTAYVCRKQACGPPTSQPDELEATLAQSSA